MGSILVEGWLSSITFQLLSKKSYIDASWILRFTIVNLSVRGIFS